ncbi:MAG TPA: hypothetical protein VE093_25655, partial [Polyangiaceae bacterium]|nr:hypothetical protein [Polyangiaceae bacterium]
VLAEHAHQGRDLGRAAVFYQRAAEESYWRGDLAGTLARAERASSCGAHGEALGQLLALKVEVCFWRQEFQAGVELAEEALALLPPGTLWWGKVIAAMSIMAFILGRSAQVSFVVQQLLSYQPDAGARVPYCTAVSGVILVLAALGAREQTRQFLERLREIDQLLGEDDALARGHISFAHVVFGYYIDSDLYSTYQHTRRAAAAFEAAEAARSRSFLACYEAMSLGSLGDYVEAERLERATLEDALSRNDTFVGYAARAYLMILLAERSEPDKWEEITALAAQHRTQGSQEVVIGQIQSALARVLMAQGRLSEAQKAAEEALAVYQNARAVRPRAYRTLIEILLRRGRLADAERTADEALQCLDELGGAGFCEVPLRLAIAEARAAGGDIAKAREALEQTLRLIDRCADQIPDPAMRARYLNDVPENVRARELARAVLGSP